LAVVGATILDFYDRSRIQCRGLTFSKWTGVSMAIDQGKLFKNRSDKSPAVVSGACFLIKADFCDVLFDEDFFCYYDDTDLSLRVRENGKNLAVLAKALVYHKGSVSANKIGGFTEFQLIRNRFRVIQKHGALLQKLTFFLITLFLYTPFRILVLLVARKTKNILYYLKGLFAGIFNFKLL
jgi:GT2 family glycosyltransferase